MLETCKEMKIRTRNRTNHEIHAFQNSQKEDQISTHLVFAVPKKTTMTCFEGSLLFTIPSNASTSGFEANLAGHHGKVCNLAQKTVVCLLFCKLSTVLSASFVLAGSSEGVAIFSLLPFSHRAFEAPEIICGFLFEPSVDRP